MMASLAALEDVRLIDFKALGAEDRSLVAIEAASAAFPLPIGRVFTVVAHRAGVVGGEHAHRRCTQLLVAVHGAVEVRVLADPERPDTRRTFHLSHPNQGVLVPPGIWGYQRYEQAGSVLMVLCDRPYEADDYIRDFNEFRTWRAGASMLA